VASEVPSISHLRQAAKGLGLVFMATALGCLTYIAVIVLHGLVRDDVPWVLIPLGVWGLLDLLAFRGRWLCRPAKASRHAKAILTTTLVVTGLAAVVEILFPTFLALIIFKVLDLDKTVKAFFLGLLWLPLVVPLIWAATTSLYLFYLRGLAQAVELYEFGTDAVSLMLEAVVIFVLIPPFLVLILWLCTITGALQDSEVKAFQTWPAILLVVLFLGLYPFIRYSNLLTRFRDALLRQVAAEEESKKRKKHPKE
jgi:hypothetical protein